MAGRYLFALGRCKKNGCEYTSRFADCKRFSHFFECAGLRRKDEDGRLKDESRTRPGFILQPSVLIFFRAADRHLSRPAALPAGGGAAHPKA